MRVDVANPVRHEHPAGVVFLEFGGSTGGSTDGITGGITGGRAAKGIDEVLHGLSLPT